MNINLIYDINKQLFSFFKNINKQDYSIYFNESTESNTQINFNNFVCKKISDEEFLFLKSNIKIASEILLGIDQQLQNYNESLDSNIWNICIYENMLFNFPYTLDDIIFMPRPYLQECLNSNKNIFNYIGISNTNDYINRKFVRTLVHEKIHIFQRYNIKNWNNYITNNSNWELIGNKPYSQLNINCTFINDSKIIHNPDTFYEDTIFGYKINNKYYYGFMIIDKNNNINNKWFNIIKSNKSNSFELYPTTLNLSKYEHPYEELAYELSNKLVP